MLSADSEAELLKEINQEPTDPSDIVEQTIVSKEVRISSVLIHNPCVILILYSIIADIF